MFVDDLLNRALVFGFEKRETTVIEEKNIEISFLPTMDMMSSYSNTMSFVFRGIQKDKGVIFYSENCDVDTLNDQFGKAVEFQEKTAMFVSPNFNSVTVGSEKDNSTNCDSSYSILLEKAKELYNGISLKIIEEVYNEIVLEHFSFGYLQKKFCTKNNLGFLYQRSEDYYYAILSLKLVGKNESKQIVNYWDTDNLSSIKAERFISKSLLKLLSVEKKDAIAAGKYSIILRNKVASQLLDAFSPIFFAENIRTGRSCLKNKIGCQIASPIINLYDCGRCNYTSHRVEFDFEGTKVRNKVLIKNGVLEDYLYDSYSAICKGKDSPGNSFLNDNTMGTDATNFFIEPSCAKFEDLLNINHGFLVTEISDLIGIVDLSSGDISATISGFEIVNGRIKSAFSNAVMNSNICDILKKIVKVDSEMHFTIPDNICSVGMPNMLVEEININCF